MIWGGDGGVFAKMLRVYGMEGLPVADTVVKMVFHALTAFQRRIRGVVGGAAHAVLKDMAAV